MRATPTATSTSGTNMYIVYRENAGDGFDSFTFENASTERFVQLAMIEWVSAINNMVKKHTLLSVRQSNLNKNCKLLSGGDVIWL